MGRDVDFSMGAIAYSASAGWPSEASPGCGSADSSASSDRS